MTEMELRGGDLLGRYELLLPIAKGGMATVWLARLSGTRGFRKIVAVKTILRGAIDDARMEQMFIEEATLAAQIHHPNVVGIHDFGEHAGTLFLAMEWVEGEPINAIVAEAAKRGGLPMAVAINVIGQACKGLHAAHELRDETGGLLGVVHRDISPQNIIVSYTGTAKVLDFGIAKATARSSTLTEAGEVKGKFAFMAPEQLYGRPVDRRADIFSLGVLAYMLTTGRHPFRGENMGETVRNICSSDRPPPRPSAVIGEYPEALEEALLKAMSKSPDDRYQTAHDFLEALENAVPECLENSFEVELSRYMHELFGARLAERRRQLRLAEERSGREELSMNLAGTSNSSLGAVAIDGMRTGVSQPAVAAPISDRASDSGSSSAPPVAPRKRKLWIAAPAAVAVLGGIFVLSRGVLVPVQGSSQVGAGSPSIDVASSGAPQAPASITPARSLPTVSDGLPQVVGSQTAPTPTADASADADGGRSRSTRRLAAPRAIAGKAGTPAPSARTESAPASAPATSPAPPAQPSVRANSWDPSTFGGRY
ncbi:MAG TPA: protein kinase [Polyangiaceae bacterium]|nr:protein kinase [Polyangiaceae bacterium]